MAVTITWSSANGGTSIAEVDEGSVGNGSNTTGQEIFIRHNGANIITNCALYIFALSSGYDGDSTAASDLSELLGWGNQTTLADFGGVEFNLNATGTYPSAQWPIYSSKAPTSGGNIVGNVCRTGVGDSASNGIPLVTQCGCTANGTIQTGSAPNVRFKMRIAVPQSEDTVGERVVNLALTYDYTS